MEFRDFEGAKTISLTIKWKNCQLMDHLRFYYRSLFGGNIFKISKRPMENLGL